MSYGVDIDEILSGRMNGFMSRKEQLEFIQRDYNYKKEISDRNKLNSQNERIRQLELRIAKLETRLNDRKILDKPIDNYETDTVQEE